MTVAADDLPAGWELPTIADVTQTVPSVDPAKHPDQVFHYVDISSIDNKRHAITATKPVLGSQAPSRARRPIQDGDVLFSNVRTYLRNIARVRAVSAPALASTGFTLLRPTSRVTQDYLFRYVTSDAFIAEITPLQTGSHYPATSDKTVRAQTIPLPPISQQDEITRTLDQVDVGRDAARSHLARARQILTDFRRVLLAEASAGRLTQDWREQRGLAEWEIVPARDICVKVQSGGTPRSGLVSEAGVPFLKVYNIVNQTIDFEYRPQFVPVEVHRGVLRKSVALPGDVVMNIVGPPLGKVAIIPGDFSGMESESSDYDLSTRRTPSS